MHVDDTSDMNNTTNDGSYLDQLDESANETLENYLLRTRGPKHLSLNIVVPITIIYLFIFVTGVVGNIAVCVVIVRNNFMHTATNYYLFSLAVSDLTLLLLGKLLIKKNQMDIYWNERVLIQYLIVVLVFYYTIKNITFFKM